VALQVASAKRAARPSSRSGLVTGPVPRARRVAAANRTRQPELPTVVLRPGRGQHALDERTPSGIRGQLAERRAGGVARRGPAPRTRREQVQVVDAPDVVERRRGHGRPGDALDPGVRRRAAVAPSAEANRETTSSK
jgi:hypothetical protein